MDLGPKKVFDYHWLSVASKYKCLIMVQYIHNYLIMVQYKPYVKMYKQPPNLELKISASVSVQCLDIIQHILSIHVYMHI